MSRNVPTNRVRTLKGCPFCEQRREIEGLRLLLDSNHAAFAAMRNDLNELFPIQSPEADLLNGPEFSVSCAAIVNAARAFIHRTP